MINAKDLIKAKPNEDRVKNLLSYIEEHIIQMNSVGNNQYSIGASVCSCTLDGVRDWYYQFVNNWDLTMSIPDIDKTVEELKANGYTVDVNIWRNGYGRPNEYKISISW